MQSLFIENLNRFYNYSLRFSDCSFLTVYAMVYKSFSGLFVLYYTGQAVQALSTCSHFTAKVIASCLEKISKTVEIKQSTIDIEEKGIRLRLTVVDTPGFGDAVNSEKR